MSRPPPLQIDPNTVRHHATPPCYHTLHCTVPHFHAPYLAFHVLHHTNNRRLSCYHLCPTILTPCRHAAMPQPPSPYRANTMPEMPLSPEPRAMLTPCAYVRITGLRRRLRAPDEQAHARSVWLVAVTWYPFNLCAFD